MVTQAMNLSLYMPATDVMYGESVGNPVRLSLPSSGLMMSGKRLIRVKHGSSAS